jgi:uncharacterized protein YprB with RNaseH-like and TPR domain
MAGVSVDTQDYLDMIESTGNLATWDVESSGFKADYNSVICASVKPYGCKPYTFKIKAMGNDVKVVRDLKDALEEYNCWLTFYGKGFDVPFVNTRLMKWGYPPIDTRHHIDLYFTLKPKTALGRKGLGSYAGFLLGDKDQKQYVGPEVWSEMGFKLNEHMGTMVERCESDCSVLEELYNKTRHLIKEIKRG